MLPEDFFEDKERRARFEREAKLLAALNHPNIAVIYSFEEVPGFPGSSARHLLAMELVEGATLRGWLASRPRPVREVVAVLRGCLVVGVEFVVALVVGVVCEGTVGAGIGLVLVGDLVRGGVGAGYAVTGEDRSRDHQSRHT